MRIFGKFEKLKEVSFHKSLTPRGLIGSAILCIFSEASREAFGTCAYRRWEIGERSYDVRFVAAKSSGTIERVVNPKIRIASSRLSSEVVQVDTIRIANTIRKSHTLYGQSNRSRLDSKSVSFKQFVLVKLVKFKVRVILASGVIYRESLTS